MKQQAHIVLMPNNHATPERSLLASVVLLAVSDACSPPSKEDRKKPKKASAGLRMHRDTFTAMRFLFDTSASGLDAYAEWLDFDLGHFRMKLQSVMADNSPHVIQGFDPMQRRNFRYNYGLWLQVRDMVNEVDEHEESDDEQ